MLLICYIKCYIKLKLGYIPSERPSTLICGTCLLVGAHYISRASGNLMIAKHLSPRASDWGTTVGIPLACSLLQKPPWTAMDTNYLCPHLHILKIMLKLEVVLWVLRTFIYQVIFHSGMVQVLGPLKLFCFLKWGINSYTKPNHTLKSYL